MFHTETEMTLAVALQTDCERLVRVFSDRLANWLDEGLIYTWKGYRVFVYESYGCHDWEEEIRELHLCLSCTPEDEYAVMLQHHCRKQSGMPDEFRLGELF